MNLKIGFSLYGLICFTLLMIPNLFWFAFPSTKAPGEPNIAPIIGILQNITRGAFFTFTILLVSTKKIELKSPYVIFMVLMLALYYIAWIRYFAQGGGSELLVSKLWFIPIPLAIFPVLFFIGETLWLKNYPALIVAVIFGVCHWYEAYQGYRFYS